METEDSLFLLYRLLITFSTFLSIYFLFIKLKLVGLLDRGSEIEVIGILIHVLIHLRLVHAFGRHFSCRNYLYGLILKEPVFLLFFHETYLGKMQSNLIIAIDFV